MVLTIWVWVLSVILYQIRWTQIDRPPPPAYAAFPYDEIRIGIDASFPPFAVATQDDLFGLEVDLGNALATEIGMPIRFINMGFDGLYDAIRADQVDMVISSLQVDPLRTQDVRYSIPYFTTGFVLVSPAEAEITRMEDIVGKEIAYEFGGAADATLRNWSRRIEEFALRPFELTDYAIDDALLHKTADAALVDFVSYRLYLREHPEIEPAHVFWEITQPYVIAIRKDRDTTWELVNHALDTLTEAGTIDQIIARWL